MSTHRPLKKSLHASQRPTTPLGSRFKLRILVITVLVILLTALGYGGCRLYQHLHERWLAQFVVTDYKTQISISATPHIQEEVARVWFGLTNNCNLAKIDFMELREKVLKEHPIVRELNVTLHVPNHLEISMEERKPIARINFRPMPIQQRPDNPRYTWDVVDADGVVFNFPPRDSVSLPCIREKSPSAKLGERLSGRALTALRLIELTTVRGIPAPELKEISTDNETHLAITTAADDILHVDWRIIDPPTDPDQPTLQEVMKNFDDLSKQNLFPAHQTYNVPAPGRITLPPPETTEN